MAPNNLTPDHRPNPFTTPKEKNPEGNSKPENTPSHEIGLEARRLPQGVAAQFESWAVEVLKDEEPPSGLDREIINEVFSGPAKENHPDHPADAFALWSALTALTQEIKLQGRAFKQLQEVMDSFLKSGSEANDCSGSQDEALNTARDLVDQLNRTKTEWEKEIRIATERRVRQELLEVFLDMRDRLVRGVETEETARKDFKPSWLTRILGAGKVLKQMEGMEAAHVARKNGYRLSLGRLEDSLLSQGVTEIHCLGRPFDPRSMNVVEVEERDDLPDGQVVEVFRAGFELNGEVFRTAQVKVARRNQG